MTTQVTEFTCSSRYQSKEEFDTLDKAVAILVIIILGLNITGSLYDIRYKKHVTGWFIGKNKCSLLRTSLAS